MVGLLIKAWRDISVRKIRSALTVLGIAVGVAGVVAIVSAARNITRIQRQTFVNTTQADLTYWVWDVPRSVVSSLESDSRIAAAEVRLTQRVSWRVGRSWVDLELIGVDDFDQTKVNRFDLVVGELPKTGEMLLDVSASRTSGTLPGMEIIYRDTHGRQRFLKVVGISQSPSHLSNSITNVAISYVPAPYLRRMLDISGSNQLMLKLADPAELDVVARKVEALLRRQGLQFGTPEIRRADQFPGKRELDALIVVMYLFSVLALLLSSFLVINTLSASISEQISEIGILKSIGATRDQIVVVYLLEALLYGLLGATLGVGVGSYGGWRLLVWLGVLGNVTADFALVPEAVILGFLVGLMVTVLGALGPALKGARVTVKEALESYGISADYGRRWLDRQLGRVRGLPALVAMAVRSLGRRQGRTLLTLTVIALGTAAFIGAASTRDSVNGAIRDIYRTYDVDAWVWLNSTVTREFEGQLSAVEGVYAAEGWALANGHVAYAEARLWGIPPSSILYREALRDGRWYRGDEPDAMVLSAELADSQGLRVGDRIEVQVDGQARSLSVVGIVVDNTIFLGGTLAGKAFLPRATLSRMLGRSDRFSLIAVGLESDTREEVDDILARVERKFAGLGPTAQPVYAEIEAAEESSRLLTVALLVMLILVSAVSALGILNTLTLNVLERRREVAVMRAIGASDAALVLTFVTEGLSMGVLGWVAGLLFGYPLGSLFTAQLSRVLFSLEFLLSPSAVAFSFLFTLSLTTLSSIGPALGAAHTSASVALRYE